MGSNPSKQKVKRSQSAAEVRPLANGHVPPRRTVSTLSRVTESMGIEKKSAEQPDVEFPQEEYKDGKLGITVIQNKKNLFNSTVVGPYDFIFLPSNS